MVFWFHVLLHSLSLPGLFWQCQVACWAVIECSEVVQKELAKKKNTFSSILLKLVIVSSRDIHSPSLFCVASFSSSPSPFFFFLPWSYSDVSSIYTPTPEGPRMPTDFLPCSSWDRERGFCHSLDGSGTARLTHICLSLGFCCHNPIMHSDNGSLLAWN